MSLGRNPADEQHAGRFGQAAANAASSCRTAGPSKRTFVSRHEPLVCPSPNHLSSMPNPPVHPMRPSTTMPAHAIGSAPGEVSKGESAERLDSRARHAERLQLARGDVHRAEGGVQMNPRGRREAFAEDVADGARHSTRRSVIEL